MNKCIVETIDSVGGKPLKNYTQIGYRKVTLPVSSRESVVMSLDSPLISGKDYFLEIQTEAVREVDMVGVYNSTSATAATRKQLISNVGSKNKFAFVYTPDPNVGGQGNYIINVVSNITSSALFEMKLWTVV